MSLDCCPVMKLVSSRITSSVFQIMILSSYLYKKHNIRWHKQVLHFQNNLVRWFCESSPYPLGLRGEMSTGGPGWGISIGKMSTHICRWPWETCKWTFIKMTFTSHHHPYCIGIYSALRLRKPLNNTHYLVYSWFVLEVECASFNMLWHKFTTPIGHLRPPLQHLQSKVLVRLHQLIWEAAANTRGTLLI